jgi:hypothetical protein
MNTKNIKPFNLEAALAGEPVMLRNGNKAFVRHHETEQEVADDFRIWGVVTFGWGECTVTSWTVHGEKTFANSLSIAIQRGYDIVGMYPTSKTRIINGFEVPAPHHEELKVGDWYFRPILIYDEFCEEERWSVGSYDLRLLERGLVFLNKEDAIANAKAMLGIDPHVETEA